MESLGLPFLCLKPFPIATHTLRCSLRLVITHRKGEVSRNACILDVVRFRGRWWQWCLQILPFIKSRLCVCYSARLFPCVTTLIFLTSLGCVVIYIDNSLIRKQALRGEMQEPINGEGETWIWCGFSVSGPCTHLARVETRWGLMGDKLIVVSPYSRP